ncbi:hypothetical protein HGA91_03730 [candidate division WWE3 bacterium]|nr:hypothetical protein [candidate division WWE3 bacterium]
MDDKSSNASSPYILIIIIVAALVTIGCALYVLSNEYVNSPAPRSTNTRTSPTPSPSRAPQATGYLERINTSPSADDQSVKQPTVVSWQQQGFLSPILSLHVGDIVDFVNNSTDPILLATGSHDDHDGYMDSGELAANGHFVFTFSVPGTWEVHNHLDESAHGSDESVLTITVK